MRELPVMIVSALGLLAVSALALRARRRQRALQRLAEGEEPVAIAPRRVRPMMRRHRLLPVIAGLAVAAALAGPLDVRLVTAAAYGIVVGVLCSMVESSLAGRRELAVQSQLADAIDIMVGALGAGAAVNSALAAAALEAGRLLRDPLDELVGRLRLGVPPGVALDEFSSRLPFEAFQLFSFALAVHWETGGSLTPVLATVGRTVRDRIELSRRIRAQATEARASAIGVLAIISGIAFVVWRTNRTGVEAILATQTGSAIWAAAVVMQAAGLLWMSKLSEVRM